MRRAHGVAGRRSAASPASCAKNFRDAEVGDFHAAFFIEQNILRFDVAMHDAFVMRKLERLANLRDDLQRLARAKVCPRAHRLPQIQPIHKFHDEVGQPVHLAEFVDGDDVGMIQLGQRAGFAIEPFGKSGAGWRFAAE